MSSAFFRRPGEDSSDSSDQEESAGDPENDRKSEYSYPGPEIELAPTESVSEEASVIQPDNSNVDIPDLEKHRDFMFAALLEEFCKTRAAELINAGAPGANFDRSSPEVQRLARTLYEESSQALSINGFLAPNSTSNDRSSVRNQYLTALDNLSRRNVQPNDMLPNRNRPQLGNKDSMELMRTGRRGSAEIIKAFDSPVSDILMQTGHMSIASPHSDMQIALARRRGHYESSFQQIGILGKGGFGRVYHAYNIFDKKDYAVKKIPLSPALSRRYKLSGHRELESVLSEVQALAQLENSNCVRYHACWIEEPTVSPISSPPRRPPTQRLLTDRPHVSKSSSGTSTVEAQAPVQDDLDGVVFGYSEHSHPTAHSSLPRIQEWSASAAGASVNDGIKDSTQANPSDIFSDGHGHGPGIHSEYVDPSLYVLHVQMSLYPLTLTQYLTLTPSSTPSTKRHCFHLLPSLRIILGILCGLQYIHAKGLIHRDIKPGNIFLSTLTPDPNNIQAALHEGFYDVGTCPSCPEEHREAYLINPRIGDFGLVAELARSVSDDHHDHRKPVGTMFYRPPQPERLQNGESNGDNNDDLVHTSKTSNLINEKLDVFALGVILLELLVPFTTSSERAHVLRDLQREILPSDLAERIDRQMQGQVQETSDAGPGPSIGERVEACVRGMLRADASVRWGCARVRGEVETLIGLCQGQGQETAKVDSA
jgi:eukaryotic translation initiation factor 2-alpha kinase 3